MKFIGCLFGFSILLLLGVNLCFATQISSQIKATNQTKQARSNLNEPHYNQQQVWNPSNRFGEMATIIPSVIFVGLILLVLPLCLSLFAPFLFNSTPYANNPWSYGYHGRRKRDIAAELNKKAKSFGLIDKDLDLDSLMPSSSTILNTVITNLGKSIQKFTK